VRTSLPLSSLKNSNRTGVAVSCAAGDEMTPRAGVRRLLNRLPLICELSSEGPRFDGLTRGVARAVVAENWIVKRGRYFFVLESMAPRKDASPREFRAIVESIVIEPRDF
jgi:hypothetical protein